MPDVSYCSARLGQAPDNSQWPLEASLGAVHEFAASKYFARMMQLGEFQTSHVELLLWFAVHARGVWGPKVPDAGFHRLSTNLKCHAMNSPDETRYVRHGKVGPVIPMWLRLKSG